jgi:hypothetical protein
MLRNDVVALASQRVPGIRDVETDLPNYMCY